MQKLILKNSEWLRGDIPEPGLQVDIEKYKDPENNTVQTIKQVSHFTGKYAYCCLGIACRDIWAEEIGDYLDKMESTGLPSILLPGGSYLHRRLTNNHGEGLEDQIARINDSTSLADEERLERLRPLFAELDIELEFRPEE